MPPPTSPPNKLMEATIMEAMREATLSRSDADNRHFLQLICSYEDIKTLDTKEKINKKIIETLTEVALSSTASRATHLAVIRKALELAADKADMLVTKGGEPFIAQKYTSNFPGEPPTRCEVYKKSILDIEKLFI